MQRSLDRGRLAHAYLFSGHHLEELEGAAATLAKVLNCARPVRSESGAAVDCCDQCDSCRRIDTANHPDVQWIRAESKLRIISIDQIRDLLHTVHLKPTFSGHKVAVVTAADRLNQGAANAFLKTLEEPPEKTVFILLTTDASRILETILSRCLRLNFAGDHGVKLAGEDAEWMGRFAAEAAGAKPGLFQRYRLLDLALGRLGEMKKTVEETLGESSPLERADLREIEPSLRKRWEEELDASIEAEYRRKRTEALGLVHWWLRDIWLLTAHSPSEYMTFPSLLAESTAVAARLKEPEAMENLKTMDRTQQILHTNAQEALTLEVTFLRLKL